MLPLYMNTKSPLNLNYLVMPIMAPFAIIVGIWLGGATSSEYEFNTHLIKPKKEVEMSLQNKQIILREKNTRNPINYIGHVKKENIDTNYFISASLLNQSHIIYTSKISIFGKEKNHLSICIDTTQKFVNAYLEYQKKNRE